MLLDDHLFRRESGRLVASLTRIFGVHNLGLAEDVAQEAFCRALEVWPLRGVPENPQAWLMATAKNRALDVIRRQRAAAGHAAELEWSLRNGQTFEPVLDDLFLPGALKDDLLRMMFACCDPRLSERTQVALVLQILCGFSIGETAAAFMSGHAAMEKRLGRAKTVLGTSKHFFDIASSPQVIRRLPAVQRALYLLFNEGYHGASAETSIRADLCQEAMRLTALLLNDTRCATPATHALGALMCLHAARLPSRVDDAGDLVALSDQDRSRWDQDLVVDGLSLLELAATGPNLSGFHVEAAIAAIHANAAHVEATDWAAIVSLYDTLMRLQPSPIVALNRAVAISLRSGPAKGLAEIRAMGDLDRLSGYPFYFAALGELERRSGNAEAARIHFRQALSLARNGDVRLTPAQVIVPDISGMSEPPISYKRHRFPPETIAHAVWLYFRFPLSLRLVEEMLLERGIVVSYETVRCWALKFGPHYARRLKRKRPSWNDIWHLDEGVPRTHQQRWRCGAA